MMMERDIINWVNGRGLSKSPIFPTTQANLVLDTPLAVMQPTLLHGTEVGLRNHEEVSEDNSSAFHNW